MIEATKEKMDDMEAAKQESVTVIHRDSQGSPDYVFILSLEYGEESGQWVGFCQELGTSTFSDTLEQVRVELWEAVELQLNEIGHLTSIQDYLAENRVSVVPIRTATSQATSFVVAAASGPV